MSKFSHTLPRLHFGKSTTTMLMKEQCNKPGLYQKNGDGRRDWPRVPLPHCWLAKVNGATSRQIAFTNSPALHLSPIEYRRGEARGRCFDGACLFAAEDANGNLSSHPT